MDSVPNQKLPSRRRLARWFGCASVFLIGLLHVSIVSAFAAQPNVFFADTVFDFGTVEQGTVVERDFPIENRGRADLYIRKIYSACGCTAAVLSSDIIPQGGKTSIKVQLDTTGFQGYKVKTVRVYTNDPDTASAVLTLKGTVQPEIETTPPSLNFGTIAKGSSPTLTTSITSSDSRFKVLSATPRNDKLRIESSDVASAGRVGKNVSVTLSPDLPVGIFRARITVKTSSSKTPVMTIPVFAKVAGDLTLSESAVSFGLVDGPLTAPLVREVTVDNDSGKPIRVLSVRTDHQKIEAKVSEQIPGKRYLVTIKLQEGSLGAVRGRVFLETDHPDAEQREVALSVYAIVARAGQ